MPEENKPSASEQHKLQQTFEAESHQSAHSLEQQDADSEELDLEFGTFSPVSELAANIALIGNPSFQRPSSAVPRIGTIWHMQRLHGNRSVQRFMQSKQTPQIHQTQDLNENTEHNRLLPILPIKPVQRHPGPPGHYHFPSTDTSPHSAVYPPPSTLPSLPSTSPVGSMYGGIGMLPMGSGMGIGGYGGGMGMGGPYMPTISSNPKPVPTPAQTPVPKKSTNPPYLPYGPTSSASGGTAPRSSSGGAIRASSPGGRVYKQTSPHGKFGIPRPSKGKPAKPKPYSNREASGYDNPAHDHSNMLGLWENAAMSPKPTWKTQKDRRDWLMDPKRRFQGKDTTGNNSKVFQGHSKGVLGHGESAGSNWNREGHKRSRTDNLEHNRQTSAYHGIEDRDSSNASGASEARYMSPGPDTDSHRSYWDRSAKDYQGGPWHGWELDPTASTSTPALTPSTTPSITPSFPPPTVTPTHSAPPTLTAIPTPTQPPSFGPPTIQTPSASVATGMSGGPSHPPGMASTSAMLPPTGLPGPIPPAILPSTSSLFPSPSQSPSHGGMPSPGGSPIAPPFSPLFSPLSGPPSTPTSMPSPFLDFGTPTFGSGTPGYSDFSSDDEGMGDDYYGDSLEDALGADWKIKQYGTFTNPGSGSGHGSTSGMS